MDLYSALDDKYLVLKTLRHGSHSLTCKQHHAFVCVRQMAPPRIVVTSSCSSLLIYRPRKDERLSWPSWLTYNARFTHIRSIRGLSATVELVTIRKDDEWPHTVTQCAYLTAARVGMSGLRSGDEVVSPAR